MKYIKMFEQIEFYHPSMDDEYSYITVVYRDNNFHHVYKHWKTEEEAKKDFDYLNKDLNNNEHVFLLTKKEWLEKGNKMPGSTILSNHRFF